MKKFKFSDGSIITASCAEEAKAKHKATADSSNELMSQKEFRIFKELAKELGLKRASGFETYEGKYKGYDVNFEYDPDSYSKHHDKEDREFSVELYPLISFRVKVYNRNKKDIKKEILDKFDEYISREKVTDKEKNLINHTKNKSKATAKFSPDETSRLEKCLELLEKQCEICGLKLYFELDNEKEYVNVYLKPDKKNVYLTVNVGGDSTATAMYEIWETIYPKI